MSTLNLLCARNARGILRSVRRQNQKTAAKRHVKQALPSSLCPISLYTTCALNCNCSVLLLPPKGWFPDVALFRWNPPTPVPFMA
jgi:hypothetical protein